MKYISIQLIQHQVVFIELCVRHWGKEGPNIDTDMGTLHVSSHLSPHNNSQRKVDFNSVLQMRN